MAPETPIRVAFLVSRQGPSEIASLAASAGWSIVEADRLSPRAAVTECDVLVTLLDGDEMVRALLLDANSVASNVRPGQVLVDVSPISAQLMVEVAGQWAALGARAFGTSVRATRNGLRAYVDSDLLESTRATTAIRAIAREVCATGVIGSSKAMATIEGLLEAVTAAASAEAIALGAQAGIPARILVPLLLKGSGGNEALRMHAREDTRGTLACVRADLARAEALSRRCGHPALFGALATVACRGAIAASGEDESPYVAMLQWFQARRRVAPRAAA